MSCPPCGAQKHPSHVFTQLPPLMQFSPAIGSFAMATKLAGYLYDKEAKMEGEGEERVCVGPRCYRCAACPQGLPNP